MDYEKMWNELKEKLKEFSLEAWDKGMVNHADAYTMTLEDMEQLEKEFKSKEDFIHTLHNDMFNKQLEKENDE